MAADTLKLAMGEMTLGQAAEAFKVPRRTLTYAAAAGNLNARKVGRQFVTTDADVRAWLRSSKHVPTRAPKTRTSG